MPPGLSSSSSQSFVPSAAVASLLFAGLIELGLSGCSDAPMSSVQLPQSTSSHDQVHSDSPDCSPVMPAEKTGSKRRLKVQVALAAAPMDGDPQGPVVATPATIPVAASAIPAESSVALQIGDQAPELSVKNWVRESQQPSRNPANRVLSRDTGRIGASIQVITFWATWCKPSTDALERLAIVQNRFANDVHCIAVSSESSEAVAGFLNSKHPAVQKSWHDMLPFSVAADLHGTAEGDFLLASSEQSLPTSFVINQDGLLAWMGTPERLESVLAKIVAGEWDIARARADHQRTYERTVAQRQVRDQLALAKVSNDVDQCLALIDGLLTRFPGDDEFELLRLQHLLNASTMTDAGKLNDILQTANGHAVRLRMDLNDDSLRLNQLAWMLSESEHRKGLDLSIAESAAERAVELTMESEASSLETLARVRFRRGNIEDAVAAQTRAIKLSPGDASLQETLSVFHRAASSEVEKAGFQDSKPDKG